MKFHPPPPVSCQIAVVGLVAVNICPTVGAVALETFTTVVALFRLFAVKSGRPPSSVILYNVLASGVHIASNSACVRLIVLVILSAHATPLTSLITASGSHTFSQLVPSKN